MSDSLKAPGDKITAVIRPFSKYDKLFFGLSVGSFFLSVGVFAYIDIKPAKYIFYISIILFVIFVIKRLQVQFRGKEIVLMDIGDDTIIFMELKNTPFFETDINKEVRIPIDKIKKINAHVIGGGSVADPSYTISFELEDGGFFHNTIPFSLGINAKLMIDKLRQRVNNVEFEVDDLLD